MNIRFILKWLKWRYLKSPLKYADTAFRMRRLWWAYNDDPNFKFAYLVAYSSTFLENTIGNKNEEPMYGRLFTCLSFMGDQTVDWKIVNFGDPFISAIMTKTDDWEMIAKLSGFDVGSFSFLFDESNHSTCISYY